MKNLIFLIAFFSIAASTQAAVLYSQTPVYDSGQGSDVDTPRYNADDFNLIASATVRTVTWRGFFCCDDFSGPIANNFTINIYSDDAGSVGALGGSYNVGDVTGALTTPATSFGSIPVFEYTADLTDGLSLSAGDYWISIFNDTTGDDDNFTWAALTGFGNSVTSTTDTNGASFTAAGGSKEFYFVLEDAPVSAVPVPAAAWLFGSAVIGLVCFKRKK